VAEPALTIRFSDVTEASGIRFRHTSGRSGRLYLPETMGSGCAFLDFDGDHRLDLFFVNGTRLPGSTEKGPFYPALYRQQEDGRFTDVTQAAGLAVDDYGMGCAVGDYDNDGDADLYLTALGPNHLFRNNGNGTFADVTKSAGVGDPRWSTSAAWLDYDRDGHLDLFVCNYCDWSPVLNVTTTDQAGFRHLVGPKVYNGAPSILYRSRGDGTFEDVTRKAGIRTPLGKSLGVLVCDLDDDGWPDLLVANDLEPNLLFRNQKDGTFREVGVEAGIAYSNASKARAGMGIDSADIAGDGQEAILIGNHAREGLALFRSDGQGSFTDAAEPAGLFMPSLPFVTFGALFADLDNDGLKEISAVNGHDDENVERKGDGLTFAQRPLLFHNQGGGRFTEIAGRPVVGLQTAAVARGLATADYDADGDLDLLISVCNGRPMLLRNDLNSSSPAIQNPNHWLAVRARGVNSNRAGLGTRVTVEAGGIRQRGWIRSGSSYCSASDLVAWFGLGPSPRVDRLTLRWPNGREQTLTDLAADRTITVREGGGIEPAPSPRTPR
jgi:enediyne biosynthesis protein E4